MTLREFPFQPLLDTSSNDLLAEFFIPALKHSVQYDRGVGFFSSAWLRIAAKGMVEFAANGGKARWVTSPILDENDWDALLTGDAARYNILLYTTLKRNIEDMEDSLEVETLSALAWMVADGILDFKLALPRNKLDKGDFHDKFGIFRDKEGNRLSFNGSYNDSVQGTRNYESIKAFFSWNPAFESFVRADEDRFENLWANLDPNVQVYDLPSAARDQILELRRTDRSYPKPKWSKSIQKAIKPIAPAIPSTVQLRDYQKDAIQAWFDAGCQGLLEMATGTGKTIAALGASIRLYDQEKRLALIVACPYQHLVDQWVQEAKEFGYVPLHAYKSKTSWIDDVNEKVLAYNHRDTDQICIITTHTTFATEHFLETIKRINGPALLIADEVHHLGSQNQRHFLPDQVVNRLALSATPDRWYDLEGTHVLREFFGKTVYSLPLPEAIEKGFLTPYYYYPILVELTDNEMIEYSTLSSKIGSLIAQQGTSIAKEEMLERLLIKRSQLLNAAENKLAAISNLISGQKLMKHTLFYCAPEQINDVVALLGWERRLRVHRFTAEEDTITRQKLLTDFESGKLQALVAMRCLDEGVDVPSTRTAYILASSSNPREFIQRRGRILRKAPGKDNAMIYDLIAIPPVNSISDDISLNAEKSLLRRELRRFAEFADSALNTQSAYQVIWDLAQQYGVFQF